MIIKTAGFVCSNTQVEKLPLAEIPEYAFIGRSNVGKSSLINMLTKQKNLAKTSSTPGKTQLINHFMVNEQWYLVDLPGYGYAKVSQKSRAEWQKMIKAYLQKRDNLQCVFVLIDSRLEPQKLDIEFCCQLAEWGVPFVLCFTKADKQAKIKTDKSIAQFRKSLLIHFESIPQVFVSSSETNIGRDDILSFIQDVNNRFVV